MVYHDDSELLKKAKVLEIAALSWYAWGVFNDQAAFYGEHLITLALFLFGYGCVRSCLREDDAEEEKPFEPAIHSLPYMRDWFATSLIRDDDPMYSLYLSWLEQLKTEKEFVKPTCQWIEGFGSRMHSFAGGTHGASQEGGGSKRIGWWNG